MTNQTHLAFHEFFSQAELLGQDLQSAGETLLRHISATESSGRVVGLRRKKLWIDPSPAESRERAALQEQYYALGQEFENLPADETARRSSMEADLTRMAKRLGSYFEGWREVDRDPIPRPVPASVWQCFECVEPTCDLSWTDNEDDPEEWASADLIAGTITTQAWEWNEHIDRVETTFSSLMIEKTYAHLILSDPDRVPTVGDEEIIQMSDDELKEWIRDRSKRPGNMDVAHKEFQEDLRYNNIKQSEFRDLWRSVTKRGRGRVEGRKNS